ncbi:MAG: midas domain-containing protein [Planctomycetota bacterium]|jgi:hypothetical protein
MIKFKKIIQKATGPSALGGTFARLLASGKSAAAPAGAAAAVETPEPPAAATVPETPEPPAAATVPETPEPPPTATAEVAPEGEQDDQAYKVDEDVVTSVLEDIFSEKGAPEAEDGGREEREALLSEEAGEVHEFEAPPIVEEALEEGIETAGDEAPPPAAGVGEALETETPGAAGETVEGEAETGVSDAAASEEVTTAPAEGAGEAFEIEAPATAEEVLEEETGIAEPDIPTTGDEKPPPAEDAAEQTVTAEDEASIDAILDEVASQVTAETETEEAAVEKEPTAGEAEAETGEAETTVEEPAEDEGASEAGEDFSTQSVMTEVDRLLAELGQIEVPEVDIPAPTEDTAPSPEQGAAEGGGADQGVQPEASTPADTAAPGEGGEVSSEDIEDEIDALASLTPEEKEALFSDEVAEEAPGGGQGEELIETISAEVDEAVEAASAGEQAAPGESAEVVMDFSAEAVGIEQAEEADSADVADVDELLSSLMAEVDKVSAPEPEKQAPKGPAPAKEDGDFSQLLGGPGEKSAEREVRTTEKGKPRRAAKPSGAPAAEDDDDPDGAELRQLAENDLITEALQEAIGTNVSEDEEDPLLGESIFEEEDDTEDTAESDAGPDDKPDESDDDGDEGGGAEEEGEADGEAEPTEIDLLANLEASFDQAQAEGTAAAGEIDEEEEQIREEVLSRSKDVEQSLLDELFGEAEEEVPEPEAEATHDSASDEESEAVTAEAESEEAPPAGGEDDEIAAKEAAVLSPRLRFGLLWIAYQMNRPFLRWLTPPVRRHLALISIGLISCGMISLAAALALLFKGR